MIPTVTRSSGRPVHSGPSNFSDLERLPAFSVFGVPGARDHKVSLMFRSPRTQNGSELGTWRSRQRGVFDFHRKLSFEGT